MDLSESKITPMKNTPLKAYVEKNKIRHQDAAEILGISRVYFAQIVNGQIPGTRLAKRIREWTGQEVSLDELLDSHVNASLQEDDPLK